MTSRHPSDASIEHQHHAQLGSALIPHLPRCGIGAAGVGVAVVVAGAALLALCARTQPVPPRVVPAEGERESLPEPAIVTLAAVGDILLDRGVGARIDKWAIDCPFKQVASVLVIERNGLRVAFVGFCDFLPEGSFLRDDKPTFAFASEPNVERVVAAARGRGAVVVASFHWGVEYASRPSSRQVELARKAVRARPDFTGDAAIANCRTAAGDPVLAAASGLSGSVQ